MPDVTAGKLDAWRERLEPMLAGLQDLVVGPEQDLDRSAESLRRLERLLLDETPPGAAPRQGLVEAAAGYLGETLLSAGGGSWEWDPASDLPVARLDAGEVIAPFGLVLDAVVRRTGDVWSAEYGRIAAGAAALWMDDVDLDADLHDFDDDDDDADDDDDVEPAPTGPGRPPRGSGTPPTPDPDPWLTTWLTTREARFPTWSAATGRAADLDFTPDSLHALEEVLRDRNPTREALRDPDDDFAQGAIWYLGEVARRHRAARWNYTPDPDGTSGNPAMGRPFVAQDTRHGVAAIPLLELQATLRSPAQGVLRERFEAFD